MRMGQSIATDLRAETHNQSHSTEMCTYWYVHVFLSPCIFITVYVYCTGFYLK